MLQQKSRFTEQINKRIIAASCKSYKFKRHTRDHRDQDDPADDPKPDRIYTDHHEEQDADHHNDQKKARSAALMLFGAFSYILHVEHKTML